MKRMLFNATHAEELRVAIVDGQRLIDLDIETAGREQRKSNIYKGVVTRVEPSLEACFVNYGEDRHGFLPFKEIAREYFKAGVDPARARIQDAISEGTELLIQIEKEERGNKGAALTTFISLAGRYLVLMPNNPRGGGVSRRIEGEDRQELRENMDQLDIPPGMSLIARTAGIGRTAEELQWDLNYLLQLWRAIDDARTLQPGAYLIYQESSLVIRAIRDYFHPDIGEILIDTDDIYEQARQFMLHVMPDMGGRVKRYSDDVPLFSRFQIEHQIDTAYSRLVPLPSGGAIVIDHTEALVAVDVNSARSTRGSDIEETAFRTNLEAAEEVGRQLRLRDLGGLIVIDFIDMESAKNQREVEQRLRDALHFDRARVQMGKISRFGLMELSRQRLRPALNEGSHITCPRCNGIGVIRDVDSSALHILRILQEEAMKEGTAALHVQVPVEVATFLLNEKRTDIAKLEVRLKVTVVLIPNKHLETPNYTIERLKHDDPRLEDSKASYALADEPAAETPYQQQKSEQAAVKPRQEAVVKSITPSSPAPVSSRNKPSSTEEVSLWSKIIGLFSGGEKKVAEESASRGRGDRQERGDRNGRDRNNRNRGGRTQDGRDRNEPRSDTRTDGRNDNNRQAQKGRGKDPRENKEPRPDANEARTDANKQKTDRPERRPRQERGDRSTERVAAESVLNGTPAVAGAEIVPTEANENGGRSRGRRRRGRGGRRDDAGQAELRLNSENPVEGLEVDSATSAAPEFSPASTAESTAVSPASDFVSRESINTPAPMREPMTAPLREPSGESMTAPMSTPLNEPANEPANEPSAAPSRPASAADVLAATQPIRAEAPPVTPASPKLSEEDLKASLNQAGLQWVQTDPNKAVEEAIAEPPPKLGRAPRKNNADLAPQEPLVMVETRHNNP